MRTLIAALMIAWTATAQAIVNIESLQAGEPPEGYSGTLDLSMNGESGNTDKIGANLGGRLEWHGGPVTNFIILRYAYGETFGVQDTNNSFAHGRHIRWVSDKTAYETFVQLERNIFARLSYRGLVGGGGRFKLAEIADVKSEHLGLGAFYSQEVLKKDPNLTDGGTSTLWRFNSYFSYVRRINDSVRMLSTTYYQPAVDDFSDFRVLEEATLSVKMSDRLALNISLDLTHDSKPPQTVSKTDAIYSTGIEYSF